MHDLNPLLKTAQVVGF